MKRRGRVDTLITRQHGAAVPDRSDGRSGLLVATRANHPTSETGRAAFNVRLEELGRRHPPLHFESGRTHQRSRSYED